MSHPAARASIRRSAEKSACVYTTSIGNYERLNEQPIAATSALPFICLTDDPSLKSETWQLRQITPVLPTDPVRSQRILKLRPHEYLHEFDYSLYIDNTVLLKEPPEQIIEHVNSAAFCLPLHSFRDTLLDEFLEVARRGLDDEGRIFEQLNHFTFDCPEVLQERPYWTGILLRDHCDLRVRATLDIWLAHVLRYSRRDQLSINLAFRLGGLVPKTLPIDNYSSWFHSWPNVAGRQQNRGLQKPAVFLRPPGARIRELERENETLARKNEVLQRRNEILRSEKAKRKRRKKSLKRQDREGLRLLNIALVTHMRIIAPFRAVVRFADDTVRYMRKAFTGVSSIFDPGIQGSASTLQSAQDFARSGCSSNDNRVD